MCARCAREVAEGGLGAADDRRRGAARRREIRGTEEDPAETRASAETLSLVGEGGVKRGRAGKSKWRWTYTIAEDLLFLVHTKIVSKLHRSTYPALRMK